MGIDGESNKEAADVRTGVSRSEIVETELREAYSEADIETLEKVHGEWLRAYNTGGSVPDIADHMARQVCPSWDERREFWLQGLAQYAEVKAVRMAEDFIRDLTEGRHIYGWDRFREFDNHQSVLERARADLDRVVRTSAQAA